MRTVSKRMMIVRRGKTILVGVAALLAFSLVALPQGPGRGRGFAAPGGFGPGFGFGGGKVVTGEPYSATAVSTSTQTLSNGNVINRSSCTQVYRDTNGRTRQDETTNSSTCSTMPQTTIIRDPVAGVEYVINNTKGTYRQMTLKAPPTGTTPPTRPSPPNSGQVQTTTLSPIAIPGTNLLAQGTQTVRTIPAGQIGNAQPIVITSTIYTSPDLQIVISRSSNDPRGGQSTYQVSNVVLNPSLESTLFTLPSGLTQQQGFGNHARPAR